jgi:alpha-beta hydrolase superfamily lysophospholipase
MAISKFSNIKSHNVFITTFLPEKTPVRAIVQINHGMAEHSARYFDFAQHLCNNGFGVYLHDHPGHGQTADADKTGHLDWNKGWDNMLDVIHNINKTIRKAHPNVPVFLFGHSMGSLLSRHYNAAYPMYFKGMIISGTTNPSTSALESTLLLVKFIHLFKAETYKSKWLNNVFYGKLSSGLKGPRTEFDWLSTDANEVEKYKHDPLCGFLVSLGFLKNLLRGTLQMLTVEKQLKFRKNFATLIISGKQDTAGNLGNDPIAIQQKYIEQGYFNTRLSLLDGRHELLNESEPVKSNTYDIIINWMDEKLKGHF